MVRFITQILVGLMLFFGTLTLLPKSYIEFKREKTAKGILYAVLALMALFFSIMAFYYAYLIFSLS